MTANQKEWNEYLDNLLGRAIERYKKTREYEYWIQNKNQMDESLTTNLTPDQKNFVDEIQFEHGLAAEHETEFAYQQGFKDCVWILKTLGVYWRKRQ